jgi:UDP-N-acetylmuramoyl-tripeptide--D-alanyl-D-alanine ligase
LFAPLPGKNADGHDFIGKALESGAAAALSSRVGDLERFGRPIIFVTDAPTALARVAEYYRSLFKIDVVGVTGSVGKTTTKDIIASVLSQKYRTVKTQGNFNNEIGLPLTIFGIDRESRIAVVEMGVSNFGEMSRLSRVARPTCAVITNIGVSHIENLRDRSGVLAAKSEIFDFMDNDAPTIINADDDMLAPAGVLGIKRKNLIRCGFGSGNDFYAEDERYNGIEGVSFTIRLKSRPRLTLPVSLNSPGRHMIQNSLAAAAAGFLYDVPPEQIIKGVEEFKPADMRMNIVRTPGGATIIDDAYNAGPDSVRAALNALSRADGRRLCVLGDMLELGESAPRLHYEIGRLAAVCADVIITAGALSRNTGDGAAERVRELGSGAISEHYEDKIEAAERVRGMLRRGDTALVKASRGSRFEEVAEILRQ